MGSPGAQPERVMILDTTLRDGELAPGCAMTQPEKLRVARALSELGVDVIEAGFPAASGADFESVAAVAREVRGPVICGLARCERADIEQAARALAAAPRPRIHVFLPGLPHRLHARGAMTQEGAQDEILRTVSGGVRIARGLCEDVEFSPEDASRTELPFLAQLLEVAIEAGATTVNIPDTVGCTVPDELAEVFRYLRKRVPSLARARLSVHCHDDLGMAVANSLTAVVAGARQIECTINGIGGRAGNCSLEEVVMALKTRAAFFNVSTGIHTQRLYPTSRLVASITGMPIPRSKAVVGENALAHDGGMLKQRSPYEILRREDVGLARSPGVLGKHSGLNELRERVQALGFELSDAELNRVLEAFKALAQKKQELFDGDIEALVLRAGTLATGTPGPWTLTDLATVTGGAAPALATVVLCHDDGREIRRQVSGDGPVDAAFKALEAATGITVSLAKLQVHSVSQGEDAQGEAVVHVEHNERTYRGSYVSTNIVEASVRAFLEVLNRIELTHSPAAPPPAAIDGCLDGRLKEKTL